MDYMDTAIDIDERAKYNIYINESDTVYSQQAAAALSRYEVSKIGNTKLSRGELFIYDAYAFR